MMPAKSTHSPWIALDQNRKRSSHDGIIEAAVLAPANIAETEIVWELAPPGGSIGVGDRNYWSPTLREELAQGGIRLLASYKNQRHDPQPERSRLLRGLHWLIETVNGQLAGRFAVKRTWAKDVWHLCSRVLRKILSHTVKSADVDFVDYQELYSAGR
jgi:hypothetical protein